MSRTQCWTEQLAATLHAHLYSPTVQRRRTAKDYVETGWFIFLFTFFCSHFFYDISLVEN